jgi:toxin ParE1/3/4
VTAKPILQRSLAHKDVEQIINHYLEVTDPTVALGFVDALEVSYRHIAQNPATGSPRYAHELNLPGLRSWPLTKYPYLILYVEVDQHIDVWRVLHMSRDIPAWMTEH